MQIPRGPGVRVADNCGPADVCVLGTELGSSTKIESAIDC